MSTKLRLLIVWIVLPSLLVTVLAIVLGFWPMPTQVQIDLQTKSVELTVEPLFKTALKFKSLTIDGLQFADFTAKSLPQAGQEKLQQLYGNANPRAQLRLESSGQLSGGLTTQALTQISAEKQQLQLYWPQATQKLEILPDKDLRMAAAYIHKQTLNAELTNDYELKAVLSERSPLIKIETIAGGGLTISLPDKAPLALVGAQAVPITNISFQQQGSGGFPVSTLSGKVQLRYLDYPKLEERTIEAHQLLEIQAFNKQPLSLTALMLDTEQGVLTLSLTGKVKKLWAGRDYRLTWLDGLWNNGLAIVVFTIGVWTVGVAVGFYKLFKEIGA